MPGYKKLLVLLDLSEDSEQVAIAGRDLGRAFECRDGHVACRGIRAGRTHGRVADAERANRGELIDSVRARS
jgi:hypothetical protein